MLGTRASVSCVRSADPRGALVSDAVMPGQVQGGAPGGQLRGREHRLPLIVGQSGVPNVGLALGGWLGGERCEQSRVELV